MERPNKKFLLITLLVGIFMLNGCDKIKFNTFNGSKENEKDITTEQGIHQDDEDVMQEKDKEDASAPAKTEEDTTVTPIPSDIKPKANKELLVYTIDPDKGEVEAATAMVSEDNEITPELIVSKAAEAMADKSIGIGIDKVTTKEDAIIVSFNSDKPPLTEVGAGIETAILDAIAQSLIENLPDYNKVIYQVQGKAYTSGHIELGLDEAYFER
ncbi:MAG: hypothetical protein E7255_12925 [Lachnospiraceae bacterium]|jgi:type III secretory pathway component EscV|nr:hypothetical protein [Lachnospiraceae bacterium]